MPEILEWGGMLNVAAALMGAVLGTMLALNLRFGMPKQTRVSRILGLLYLCLVCFSAANLADQFLNGDPGAFARVMMPIACFCDYLFTILLVYLASGLLFWTAAPTRKPLPLRWVLRGLTAAQIVLLIVSQFTGLFYTINVQNVYERTVWYPLSLIAPTLMLLLDAYVLFRNRRQIRREDRIAFGIFLAFPIVGVVLQLFFHNMVALVVILDALWLYGVFSKRQIADAYQQQAENLQLRTQAMMSQIQPHFLYNSLGAIADLCDLDPQKAKETTIKFSQYLRGNMNALSTDKLIPFSQELAHTKQYLELQKVRFEDDLQIRFEITCTDFAVPTLSLQPLAENAVRHGIRQNPDGRGTVIISTRETDDFYEIAVTDDGPGFDLGKLPDGETLHIGLQNARERLRLSCNGALEIADNLPHGVIATIRIPKE